MCQQTTLHVCEYCFRNAMDSELATFTSCDYFSFCNLCASYQDTEYRVQAYLGDKLHQDKCDCLETKGRISHFSGGNYHHTEYEIEAMEKIGRA